MSVTVATAAAAALLVVVAVLAVGRWLLDTLDRALTLPGPRPLPTPAARHRRTETSPRCNTATGVIRRIDPSMLPTRRDTPR